MALSQVVDFASQSFGLEGRLGSFFFGIGEGDLGVLNILVRRRGVRVPFLRAGREGLSELLKVIRQERWLWYGGHINRRLIPREGAT